MATKQWTVFVVDHASGIDYVLHHGAQALLLNRKLDRLSLVTDGNTTFVDAAFTYDNLKAWYSHLDTTVEATDLEASMAAAKANLEVKLRLKFSRYLVIATTDDNYANFADQVENYTGFITNNSIKVVLVGVSAKGPWKPVIDAWKCQMVPNPSETLRYNTAIKRVLPMKTLALLQIGRDVESSRDALEQPAYFTIPVGLYPAVKPLAPASASEYKYDPLEGTAKVGRRSHYYVNVKASPGDNNEGEDGENGNDDNEAEGVTATTDNIEKLTVDPGDRVPAFKYSKHDLVVVNEYLKEMATLDTVATFDVLGFSALGDLPYPYITGELKYVVPAVDHTGYNLFVTALGQLERFAFVRYVPKPKAAVQIGALLPVKFAVADEPKPGLVFVPLAFAEDEKFGKFPYLTPPTKPKTEKKDDEFSDDDASEGEESDDSLAILPPASTEPPKYPSKRFPTADTQTQMDEFVERMSFNETPTSQIAISNPRLDLRLLIPVVVDHGDPKSQTAQSKLLASSPSIAKYDMYLEKIIVKLLAQALLNKFTITEDFATKNLVDPEGTNLYNLGNILEINNGNRGRVLPSPPLLLVKGLMEKLDVSYRPPVEKTTAAEGEGREAAATEEFADFVNIDDILGH
ncbi:hypothetical protein JNB11_08930 [Kocuria palustris]|nr:hypothetical protein [Kocuria palustris]